MLNSLTGRLALTASLVLAASGAMATNVAIDTGNAANGLTDLYSATFDGALTPCSGSSPSYCAFFGGEPGVVRNITFPTPTGVINGVPLAIAPAPAAGSFLDVSLTGGNTTAQILGGTIALPTLTLSINGASLGAGTAVVTATGAGFTISPSAAAAVNGAGQVEFLQNNSPAVAADFSTLASIVTSCVPSPGGGLCGLLPILNLDMVRYRLFLDFDPTFTSFTGEFIGQTANNSIIYATLNSAPPIPVPAAVWFMASGLGLLGALRRKSPVA